MSPHSHPNFGLVIKAASFAAEKHREQRRKGGDLPYINHPLAVADLIWDTGGVHDPVTAAAAILHDTIEDTATTVEDLEKHFGPVIRDLVLEVTVDKLLSKPEQRRLEVTRATTLTHRAKLIRLADKAHNLFSLIDHPPVTWTVERQRQYAEWCAELVVALGPVNPGLESHFQNVLRQVRRVLALR